MVNERLDITEDPRAYEALRIKDAEIARLKGDVEYWHHIATIEKKQLITELCDALKMSGLREYTTAELTTVDVDELVARVREAAR